MVLSRAAAALCALLLVLAVLTACVSSPTTSPFVSKEAAEQARRAADLLDEVDEEVAMWGTGFVSAPAFVPDTGQFKIDYDMPVADYIAKARHANASVGRFAESVLEGQTSIRAQTDELVKSSEKKQLESIKRATAPSDQNAPQLGEYESVAPDAGKAKSSLSGDRFKDFMALTDLREISEGDALKIGISQKVTEQLLEFMAHPKIEAGSHKLFLGVIQVSCTPGWKTREGFYLDLFVTPEYAATKTRLLEHLCKRVEGIIDAARASAPKSPSQEAGAKRVRKAISADPSMHLQALLATASPAKSVYTQGQQEALNAIKAIYEDRANIPDHVSSRTERGYWIQPGNRHPTIVSVFPMLEAQTLDLQNSERSQTAGLASLGALFREAGAAVQAEQIIDYVERLQVDAASRNPRPVISSYNDIGGFGYQFRPLFEAIAQPDNPDESGFQLHPVTFPGVVAVLMEKEEIEAWDLIGFSVNVSWRRLKPRHWFNTVFVDWWLDGRYDANYTNARRIEVADKLDGVLDVLAAGIQKQPALAQSLQFQELRRRYIHLKQVGLGRTVYTPLPKPESTPPKKPPSICEVNPQVIWRDSETLLVVRGRNFRHGGNASVKHVTLGGRRCAFEVVSEEALLVVVPAWRPDLERTPRSEDEIELVVVAAGGTDRISERFTLRYFRRYKASDKSSPEILIHRDEQGRIWGITVRNAGAVSGTELLESLRQILGKNQCGSSVKVDISSHATTQPQERKQ